MDDTLVIQKAEHSQQFLHYVNCNDPHIQFIVEDSNSNESEE